MRHWIWVFGEIAGLRWVLEQGRMAFPDHAAPRLQRMRSGDREVLYVTRGACHNPIRDQSRLSGITTVTSQPVELEDPVVIGEREFGWVVDHQPDILLDERTGPLAKTFVENSEFVRKPAAWGAYFRPSPIEVSPHDFEILEHAVVSF